jgi:hypothetical protein
VASIIPCLALIFLATFQVPKDDRYEISDPNLLRAIEADLNRSYRITFIDGAKNQDFKKRQLPMMPLLNFSNTYSLLICPRKKKDSAQ